MTIPEILKISQDIFYEATNCNKRLTTVIEEHLYNHFHKKGNTQKKQLLIGDEIEFISYYCGKLHMFSPLETAKITKIVLNGSNFIYEIKRYNSSGFEIIEEINEKEFGITFKEHKPIFTTSSPTNVSFPSISSRLGYGYQISGAFVGIDKAKTCDHNWSEYIGLNYKETYCTKCPEKKNKRGIYD